MLRDTNNYDHQDLSGKNFDSMDLRGASFVGAILTGASFVGANLTGSNFGNAILNATNFKDADLTDVNLCGASVSIDPEEVKKYRERLKNHGIWYGYAHDNPWMYVQHPNFYNANLTRANLKNADFRYADLDRANLQNASLENTNLIKATCWNVSFTGVDLSKTPTISKAWIKYKDYLTLDVSQQKAIIFSKMLSNYNALFVYLILQPKVDYDDQFGLFGFLPNDICKLIFDENLMESYYRHPFTMMPSLVKLLEGEENADLSNKFWLFLSRFSSWPAEKIEEIKTKINRLSKLDLIQVEYLWNEIVKVVLAARKGKREAAFQFFVEMEYPHVDKLCQAIIDGKIEEFAKNYVEQIKQESQRAGCVLQ